MIPESQVTVHSRTQVSMLSLKWGDFLSTFLPGALALFAIAPFIPLLNDRITNLQRVNAAEGFALLTAAALTGGILEAFTRVFWERLWLVKRCCPKDALINLDSENFELYERGVQSSYKYVTFYANFAWAAILLVVNRLYISRSLCSPVYIVLVALTVLLLRASHIQWTYYVNYQNKVIKERGKDASKRPTAGDGSEIPPRGTEGESGQHREAAKSPEKIPDGKR